MTTIDQKNKVFRILVTGSSGMLAADVIPELKRFGHIVFSYDINQRLPETKFLDIAERDNVFQVIKNDNPDYVFHLAAETDVDRCQLDPEHAFRINASGTENIALACKEYNIPLVYISTAGVFYGDKAAPYTEEDTPRPINVYGESKLKGEEAVRKLLSRYFIVRAGWMVGGWEIDKKFVYKIVQQLKQGKKELRVVSDKRGTPTFTKDFAGNLMNVVNTNKYDTYHMANKGICTRYDIAVKIVEFMGLNNQVKVNAIDSSQFPLPAPRADSEAMENFNLGRLGINNMPHWHQSLSEYININKNK